MKKLIRFLKREDGLESVEYALLGVLIVLAIVASVILLRDWIIGAFTAIAALPGG
jgi:Flp pilus assembly pilin Flp